jgi:superfamily II DNA or RNA helicase
MSALPFGIYEEILTCLRKQQLAGLGDTADARLNDLDAGDSHAALADYLKSVFADALDSVEGDDRLAGQIDLCNRVIQLLRQVNPDALNDRRVSEQGKKLLAVVPRDGGRATSTLERPDTPLAFGCLLTGTRLDPSLVSQIRKELRTADRVDILCSFIKWSGLRIIDEDLQAFVKRPGAQLRVLTTSYMGATDPKAIEWLSQLPNTQIRVSYDTHRTRLHAKAYMFHRQTRFGAAYVGSANLSHAAMTDGLEWTVKISQHETPHLWQKVTATFETYWNDGEFVAYNLGDKGRLEAAIQQERAGQRDEENPYIFDLQPYTFQQEILDRLAAERQVQGRSRHLVVAATGTGKTMIAAFDYRNWCRQQGRTGSNRPSLLYVAHREEILKQSLQSFKHVLRDFNFGDLLVGGLQPNGTDHLFVSIQSYNSRRLGLLPADQYEYVVVDEFHHAAADSYQQLLGHVQPKVLLGLTATPERADGLDVTACFDGHITAEIRLPDAINRKLLCPFQYFGVTDAVDLDDVRWKRGGYDIEEIERRYTGNEVRVQLIVDQVRKTLLDVRQARGLGFCVSIAHAKFMAEQFCRHGIPAEALSADSSNDQRQTVQGRLRSREINFIFAVDLYNEGVDIPEVDTVLFLRPTESLTVFLQQLGRGLRLSDEKDCLTVLDFVGRASRSFRFDLRFRSLLLDQGVSVLDQVQHGFSHLPAGCSIQLERKAREYILENVRQAVRQSRQTLVRELKTYAEGLNRPPTLAEFLRFFHLDLDDIYRREISWSRLCVEAGIRPEFHEPDEEPLTKGFRRFQHIDSADYIRLLLGCMDTSQPLPPGSALGEDARRQLLMMHFALWGKDWLPTSVLESVERVRQNPMMCAEMAEMLHYKLDQVQSVSPAADLPFPCPLTLHSQYTRDEILAALGHWTLQRQPDMREGVLHLPGIHADAFFITLNKTDREFSPTTMYRDYAINDRLFHWQSQSTTSVESPTGQRYIRHREHGHTILLFVREYKKANGLASPYSFLGPAEYVSHEGSRPINIIWRLQEPMPAALLRRTARLATA